MRASTYADVLRSKFLASAISITYAVALDITYYKPEYTISLYDAPGNNFFDALYTFYGSAFVAFYITDKKLFFDFYYHFY